MTDLLDGSPVVREVLGEAYDRLAVFHAKLMAEGEPRGLIGPRDVPIVWERHILNSAAIVPFVRDAVRACGRNTIADIGSGGGFPGIVVAACMPDCKVTLVEPMERRVTWLEECVREMDLRNVRVRRARAEELMPAPRKGNGGGRRGSGARRNDNGSQHGGANAGGHAERFGVVTCRAVAPMTKLSGWTLPLLAPGGRLVALKGRSAQAEIEKADKVIRQYGGVHPRVVEAAVGPGLEPTHVVIVGKR
ncbi:16S rRNA (guanine(527)-N(7))-methyltransferase RsmG [Bifidobacterium moraviense]|uniref:16S rRNA (guanine(527)-N(7))-methyltransferase RsmG n=1 Tax=Bifidobacterium moraviense TaxID=2675323 RepID=UPI002FFD2984